jgi:hypothetical protein
MGDGASSKMTKLFNLPTHLFEVENSYSLNLRDQISPHAPARF